VTIEELQMISVSSDEITLAATVSKGTYIRSLARDIARALGTVGHVFPIKTYPRRALLSRTGHFAGLFANSR